MLNAVRKWLLKGLMDTRRGRQIAASILQPYGFLTQEVPRHDMNQMLSRFLGEVYAAVSLVGQQLAEYMQPHVFVRVPEGRRLKNPNKPVSRETWDGIFKTPMLRSGARDEFVELTSHPLIDLFTNINPLWPPADFFEILSTYLDLTGEAYIYLTRGENGLERPDEMWALPPQWMTPRYDDVNPNMPGAVRAQANDPRLQSNPLPDRGPAGSGVIRWWQYGPGAQYAALPVSEVLMLRRPSPYHQIRGFAPMASGVDIADTSQLLRRYQKSLLSNRGVPDHILSVSGSASPEKVERFKTEMRKSFGMFSGGSGGILIAPGDEMKLEALGYTPHDMENVMADKANAELIWRIFKIPPAVFSAESQTRAASEAALYQFAKMCLKPRMLQIQQKFNGEGGLTEMFGDPSQLILAFDDPVPQDTELVLKERTVNIELGVTNVNEERAKMGLEPREGGDEYRDPMSPEQQIEMASARFENSGSNGNGSPTRGPDNGQKSLDVNLNLHSFPSSAALDVVATKAVVAESTPGATPEVPGIEGVLIDEFERQESDIIDALKATGLAVTAAALLYKIDLDGILDNETMADRSSGFLKVGFDSGVQAGQGEVGSGVAPVDLNQPGTTQAINRGLESFSRKFAESVNATTARTLQDEIQKGIDAGETLEQIVQRVRDIYKDATLQRAELIARTESKRAIEAGRKAVYGEHGITKVMWIAAPDSCEFCRALDTKTIDIDGGKYLGVGESLTGVEGRTMTNKYIEVQYPPLHPNCRCTTLAVLETES